MQLFTPGPFNPLGRLSGARRPLAQAHARGARVILATSLDLDYLSGRDYTTIRLRHANTAIRQVLVGINASSTNAVARKSGSLISSDEIFFAVMSLAKQSDNTCSTPVQGTAMQQIVRSRSGLADAGNEAPGFAEALYQFDILESAKTLSRPWMDMPSSRWRLLSKETTSLRNGVEKDVRDRFIRALLRTSDYTPLLVILSDIRVYCICVKTLHGQMEPGSTAHEPSPPLSRDLSVLRDTIEHRLLAYTFVDDSVDEQLCQTTALIFTHFVIYPLPNREPLEILLDRLMASLRRPLLVWVSTIGAMACPAAADRTRTRFFSKRLTAYAAAEGISSWSQLRRLLEGFLWLDRACPSNTVHGTQSAPTASDPQSNNQLLDPEDATSHGEGYIIWPTPRSRYSRGSYLLRTRSSSNDITRFDSPGVGAYADHPNQ
ncbi:hypothetical protein G647_06876 [Cladophialophora carrionii CBS 160.54]|uniref:Uncharacterized protein n=1 Tax=Cladophialophora carrionii CBS 160.54 TaxID=1279043 RepID=V9D7E3_9EURO|nr:uncharacterized protein G647_06876 [Cladophialophora carrionii CBS 160.54]ETI22800.1 hypothetical protein G647_06876 [Cladophialophora carrionii CBS 160.54]